MPNPEQSSLQASGVHSFQMNVVVFGPIRPAADLHRQTQRALKGNSTGHDVFTEITLHDSRNTGGMRVEYTVTASSPASAERAGAVYLSQLCDLLSAVTRCPVWFYMPEEDAREERARAFHRAATVDRILTEPEWSWITGNLVFLRREHPRFLAATSWFRKGLIGRDTIDDFCCFWRVIERLAYSYADKSGWSDEDKAKSSVKKLVGQLMSDLFPEKAVPVILANPETVSQIVKLRNDLSHGNIPLTLEVIDTATGFLKPLEEAAFSVLNRIRQSKLHCEILA